MTQEQIDGIRERMCNLLCVVPVSGFIPEATKQICSNCPLNELEASE